MPGLSGRADILGTTDLVGRRTRRPSTRSGASISTDPPALPAAATSGPAPRRPPGLAADPGDALGSAEGLKGVLRIGDFRRVWYATALSSLGDWLGLLATTALAASLATSYEGENYALGLVLVVRLLPSVLLGPLAGAFADRFDRRHTMVVSDLLRFVLFMAIPLSLKLHIGNDRKLLVLYVASFLVECVSLFWNPAKDASVPNLVGREHVEAANQLGLITTYGLTPVAAAGLFSVLAILTDRFSASASNYHPDQVLLSLYFNAATFVVAAAVIYTVRSISGAHERKADAEQPGLFAMLGEGVTFMSSSKLLRGVIVGILGAFAAGGGVIGAGHTYVTSLGGGNAAYGVLFGAVFVGLGLGMAVAPKITKRMPRRLVFGLGIVLAGVCLVLTSLAPHVILAMIVVVGVGFGGGVSFLSGLTLLGTEISDDMRGRVFAFIQSLVRVVLILSLAAVPFIVGRVGQPSLAFIGAHVVIDGTRIVLALGGVLAILAGLSAYRLMGERRPIRYVRRGGREATNGPGLLIAFEGGEGSGKSTQINALAESLRADGVGRRRDLRTRGDTRRQPDPGHRAGVARRSGRPRRGPAVRGRPGQSRGHGDPPRSGSGPGGAHRPVRRFLAGLPGRRPVAVGGGGAAAVQMGHRRPRARPDRRPRHPGDRRPGPGGPAQCGRPAGAGVDRVPPARA